MRRVGINTIKQRRGSHRQMRNLTGPLAVPVTGCLKRCFASVLAGWLGLAGPVAASTPPANQSAEAEQADPTSATNPQTPRPLVATEQSDQALSRLRPEAAVWLDLESAGRALGLFYPEREPPANGALVILADVGDNAASGVADELSRQFTAKGWAVLALGLPAPAPSLQRYLETQPIPVSEDSDNKEEATAGDQSSVMIDVMAAPSGTAPDQRYRDRVRESLAAAKAALAERGYEQPALIGLGRASNHLVALGDNLQGVRALIWVAPDFYARDAGSLAEQLASGGNTAILELYTSRGAASDDSQRRWAELRRAGIERLERQPVAVSRPLAVHGAGAIAGRIAAWLKTL